MTWGNKNQKKKTKTKRAEKVRNGRSVPLLVTVSECLGRRVMRLRMQCSAVRCAVACFAVRGPLAGVAALARGTVPAARACPAAPRRKPSNTPATRSPISGAETGGGML